VIVGRADEPETIELRARIHAGYIPNKTVVVSDPASAQRLPVAEGKAQLDGRTTAYVCHGYTCSTPVTDWSALEPLLESARG